MTTTTSITSLHQGQLYGSKPTLEEFERQLEADPMTRAFNQLVAALRRVRLLAKPSAFNARRQGNGLSRAALNDQVSYGHR